MYYSLSDTEAAPDIALIFPGYSTLHPPDIGAIFSKEMCSAFDFLKCRSWHFSLDEDNDLESQCKISLRHWFLTGKVVLVVNGRGYQTTTEKYKNKDFKIGWLDHDHLFEITCTKVKRWKFEYKLFVDSREKPGIHEINVSTENNINCKISLPSFRIGVQPSPLQEDDDDLGPSAISSRLSTSSFTSETSNSLQQSYSSSSKATFSSKPSFSASTHGISALSSSSSSTSSSSSSSSSKKDLAIFYLLHSEVSSTGTRNSLSFFGSHQRQKGGGGGGGGETRKERKVFRSKSLGPSRSTFSSPSQQPSHSSPSQPNRSNFPFAHLTSSSSSSNSSSSSSTPFDFSSSSSSSSSSLDSLSLSPIPLSQSHHHPSHTHHHPLSSSFRPSTTFTASSSSTSTSSSSSSSSSSQEIREGKEERRSRVVEIDPKNEEGEAEGDIEGEGEGEVEALTPFTAYSSSPSFLSLHSDSNQLNVNLTPRRSLSSSQLPSIASSLSASSSSSTTTTTTSSSLTLQSSSLNHPPTYFPSSSQFRKEEEGGRNRAETGFEDSVQVYVQNVLRRFSEFVRLDQLLRAQFTSSSSSSLPKLPSKLSFSRQRDPAFLEKRRKNLEAYLLALLAHPLASQTTEVLCFLGLDPLSGQPLESL